MSNLTERNFIDELKKDKNLIVNINRGSKEHLLYNMIVFALDNNKMPKQGVQEYKELVERIKFKDYE